ncbi:ferredoxin-type protein NapG [Uliginosibacterium sp. TH139]|uniref:ferredoxin-type protein NapG n=1 Tax=Uliginosibacterium sp. TH139 TaxID=2067453 RepID=UPI000C7DD6E6|nr:ferredoxin-type protein NapG [Uliginosibacterium sp. TH139]PLK49450.1 ferredoxin-type protein NapG [Uliginosibacterium sp. TH139]
MSEPTKPANASPRRRFLKEMAGAAGGACLLAMGVTLYSKQAGARPAQAIRPPGALMEEAFLGACIRCGLCVRDCPYDTLKLATPGDGIVSGTPYFTARDIPCEMCEDIPCVKACPSGALDHALSDIRQAEMGIAVLIDQENCLNFLGLRCDVCYRVCPVIDKAITLEMRRNPREEREGPAATRHAMLIPTVHADACTGCGKCEKSCILPEAAIKVLPAHIARGAPAEHYRRGWEEKGKAGGSLIGDQVKLPVRGLDDQSAPGGQP